MYINLFLAFIGKYIAEHFFHFQSREDIMVLVGLDTFWKNLGSIFLGYFKLLGGMRGDTSVVALSTQGIKYLSRFAVAAMVLIMFAICLYMHLRKKIKCKGLYAVCSVVVFHVVMYAVLYTSYAQTVFEIRYLILPYLGMLICAGKWLDELDRKLLFKWVSYAAMLGCIVIVSITSFRIYRNTKIDREAMEVLKENVAQIDSPVVYVVGDEILCRNMRAFDTDKVYKCFQVIEGELIQIRHWGDYTYYDFYSEHSGKIIMAVTNEAFTSISPQISAQMDFVVDLGGIVVYSLEENIFGIR